MSIERAADVNKLGFCNMVKNILIENETEITCNGTFRGVEDVDYTKVALSLWEVFGKPLYGADAMLSAKAKLENFKEVIPI